jgi:2-polyprenyl-6-methoxyphenol hydroxylase-like FAD-dependent oxidoreductase
LNQANNRPKKVLVVGAGVCGLACALALSSKEKGNVWIVGNAAQSQLSVGGQRFNLAVWDGVTLGCYLADGGRSVEKLLINKARRTLIFTDFDYHILSTKSLSLRTARNSYWLFASKYPSIASWVFRIISGS